MGLVKSSEPRPNPCKILQVLLSVREDELLFATGLEIYERDANERKENVDVPSSMSEKTNCGGRVS